MDSLSYSYGIIHAEMLKKNKHFRLDPYESGLSKVCDNKERNVSYDNIFTDVWKGKQYHQKQRQLLYDDSQMTNILYNYKDSFFIGVYIGNQFRKHDVRIVVSDYIKAIKDLITNRPTILTIQQANSIINDYFKSGNHQVLLKPQKKEKYNNKQNNSLEQVRRVNTVVTQNQKDTKKRLSLLYSELLRLNYDVGTYESFIDKLKSEIGRKALYNVLVKEGYDLGTFDNFQSKVIEGISLYKPAFHKSVPAANPTSSSTSSYISSSSSSSANISTSSSSSSVSSSTSNRTSPTISSSSSSKGSFSSSSKNNIGEIIIGWVITFVVIGGIIFLLLDDCEESFQQSTCVGEATVKCDACAGGGFLYSPYGTIPCSKCGHSGSITYTLEYNCSRWQNAQEYIEFLAGNYGNLTSFHSTSSKYFYCDCKRCRGKECVYTPCNIPNQCKNCYGHKSDHHWRRKK